MRHRFIFVLTGAGLSAESGLGTFRDQDGLWAKFNIDEVASRAGYEKNPSKVLDFYNMRRANMQGAAPNAAHAALAKLQIEWQARGGRVFLCTQNIDGLLEIAGAADVVHMHGEIAKSRCDACGDIALADGDILVAMGCPACGRGNCLRPHIVWFGEQPLFMEAIQDALERTDLFASIGTSGAVYPAAGFVDFMHALDVPRIEINLAPSDNGAMFSDARYGPASEQVPLWVEEFLAGQGQP